MDKPNVTFENLKVEEIKFGKKNFLEVAKKKATSEGESNEFISISRGYYGGNGQKIYKSSVAVPLNDEVLNSLVDRLNKIRK